MKSGTQKWLLMGSCLMSLLCVCIVGVLGSFILRITHWTTTIGPPFIGPTFTTVESLAYNVIYDSQFPQVDPNTIRAIQKQTADGDDLHFVLMRYEVDGQEQIRPFLGRRSHGEFFFEPMEDGPAAANDNFEVAVLLHPNARNIEVAIYGQIYTPSIDRITITWPNGRQQEAVVVENSFLWFQSWSPVDGEAVPARLTAYGAGNIISELSLEAIK